MSWIDIGIYLYSFILFIPLDTASLFPPSAPCKAFGKVLRWHDGYFILSKLNYSVDDDALRWPGWWWWWWWPNTINISVGKQIYQVGSTASTSCKLCKGASRLKTHIVDKLLVHEIWDSKFKQNIKNMYREHLGKGARERCKELKPVSSDVVMICKTCKLDSSILDVDPSARLTCNSIYENDLFLQSYVFKE